jgi:dihydrofolate synthase/folylpolyglutamate synthase
VSYKEAIRFLYDLRWFGTKLGLNNTFKLAALAGNPQRELRFIHVAGTNGKGSTCAMLESIYRTAGLRVGLFTSPHLVTFGERLQVNRKPIGKEAVVRLVVHMQRLLREFPRREHPTFFEVVTVMALRYFAAQKCDLVIWETGLGGRLDATNIVTPLASVITNVQYDHQKWLGNKLTSIAREKGGIIKAGIPVIAGPSKPEALQVIRKTARERKAPLREVIREDTEVPPLESMELPLLGAHQRMNAAVAIAAVRALNDWFSVSEKEIREGLSSTTWPGRLQLITQISGRKILLDGAHNVAGVETLITALRKIFPATRRTLILGILEDKDWRRICRMIAPLAQRVLFVAINNTRTVDPRDLSHVCARANPGAEREVCGSVEEALGRTAYEPLVVVTGSLYLVGEALELLEMRPQREKLERPLNEWGAAPFSNRRIERILWRQKV